MNLEGKDDTEISDLCGKEPFLNRFRVSPKALDAKVNLMERSPIGFHYFRMEEKTYKYVIKRVCVKAGIKKPITLASL